MKVFDYIILGAGLGGLAAAACLTKQGKKVAVFEKHYFFDKNRKNRKKKICSIFLEKN